MAHITKQILLRYSWIPVRNCNGVLIAINISRIQTIKIKFLSSSALEYVLSLYPMELSSLEKELL